MRGGRRQEFGIGSGVASARQHISANHSIQLSLGVNLSRRRRSNSVHRDNASPTDEGLRPTRGKGRPLIANPAEGGGDRAATSAAVLYARP
jgi:hypothetical protein